MSSYVGNRSNDPIIDFMLDTLEARGWDAKELDKAVEAWNEDEGEDNFWSLQLGPTIDNLDAVLSTYKEDKDAAQ